jgi:hypothetical protein
MDACPSILHSPPPHPFFFGLGSAAWRMRGGIFGQASHSSLVQHAAGLVAANMESIGWHGMEGMAIEGLATADDPPISPSSDPSVGGTGQKVVPEGDCLL